MIVAVLAQGARAEAPPYVCKPDSTLKPTVTGDPTWPLLAQVMPREVSHCIDGEVIGVVAAYTGLSQPPSSDRVEPLEAQRDPDAMLALPLDPVRRLLVPGATERPESMRGGDGTRFELAAVPLTYRARKKHKLTADAHLVKLSINGGRGAAPPTWMVIGDKLEVLDGTPAYPLKVSKLLHETLDPLEAARTKQGKRWRVLLRTAVDGAVKQEKEIALDKSSAKGEDVGAAYRVAWHPDKKTLQVVFYGRFSKWFTHREKPRGCSRGDPDCLTPAPPVPYVLVTRTYAAEYAYEAYYDVDGKLVSSVEYPVGSPPVMISTSSPF